MSKNLEIRYLIDDSQAKQVAAAEIARAAKVVAAWDRAAKARAAGSGNASGGSSGSARNGADPQAKAEARAADAAQKAQDKVVAAHKRAADAAEKLTQRQLDADVKAMQKRVETAQKARQATTDAAEKAAAAAMKSSQKIQDAEQARTDKLARLGKEQLANEEVTLRARARANQKFQQQRVDSAAKALRGENESAGAADRFGDSLGRLVLGFAGIQSAEAIFRGVTQAIGESRNKSSEFAKDLIKTKDELAEIATLRGLAFADDDFVKKMASFSRSTGLSMKDSDQFQRQLYGSAQGAIDKGNIDAETLDQAAVLTGQAASRQTKDFSTRGDLTGVVAGMSKHAKGAAGAKQLASEVEAVRLGLTEGRGDDAPLSRAFLTVAGNLAGDGMAVKDAPELAALIGTTSLSVGPGMADTRAEQLYRGVRGTTPQQMGFLKDFAKIGEHDSLEQRLDKMVPALRAQKDAGRDIGTFLTESGMNEEQTRALVDMTNGSYEIFKARMVKARSPVSGEKIAADNQKFKESPVGRDRTGAAEVENAKLEQGEKRQQLEAEMKSAEAELLREGLDTNPLYQLEAKRRSFVSMGTVDGRDQMIQERALKRMRERSGIPQDASPYGGLEGGGFLSSLASPMMNLLGLSAGVDAPAEAANHYSEFMEVQKKQLTELEKLNGKPAGQKEPTPTPPARDEARPPERKGR